MAANMITVVFIMFTQTSNAATITPTIGETGSGDIDDQSIPTKNFTNKYHSTEQLEAIMSTSVKPQPFSGQNINHTMENSTSVEASENILSSSAFVEETTSTVTSDIVTSANNEITITLLPYSSTTKKSLITSPIITSIKTQSTTPDLTTELRSETDAMKRPTTYIRNETYITKSPTTYLRDEIDITKRPTTYMRETDVTKRPTTYISVTSSSIEPSIVENETTKSLYTDNTVTERTSNYTVENVHSTEDIYSNSTLGFVKSTITTTKPSDISQTASFSDITTAKMSNVSKNKEIGTEDDNLLLHLAYILPSAFVLLLAVLISGVCLYRYKRRKKAEDIHGGYVQKRRKISSTPAFMQQNMNALAYQFQSRDSKVPSAFKTKLGNQGNGFEEIELSEDNQIAEQNSDKNQRTVVMESNFNQKSKDRSFFTTLVENEQKYDTDDTPPLPGKGNKIQNVTHDTSASHYDVLPLRESLPVKQRRQNSIDEIQGLSRNMYKNPEYDVLPLRTFTHNQLPTDSQDRTFLETTKKDINSIYSVPTGRETKLSIETFNVPDEVFRDDTSASGSKSETETEQDMTELDMFENNAVDKLKRREPAVRAPSFVALPRAASGSLRTAL
ncbi:uncharacterized protein LOC127728300 [Mytilus californianus]|uniref:uncharacterized protein LOC127728300 n=1 Tax=Mytilus californianus TaxID=6549 RepID=UPI002245E77C|nr:uncharacterized protein LOC127728300 [Mytilus californianus]